MPGGIFDFQFTPQQQAFYKKYKDVPDNQFTPEMQRQFDELFPSEPIEPLQPMQAPPPPVTPQGLGTPGGSGPLMPGLDYGTKPAPGAPVGGNLTDTYERMYGPQSNFSPGMPVPPPPTGGLGDVNTSERGGLLNSALMNLGRGGGTVLDDGGGLLGGAGGGAPQPKGWGPMLMALGGGIASTPGNWGAGIGAGLSGAATARQRQDALNQTAAQNAAENAYRQQALAAATAKANVPPTTDDITEWKAAGSPGTLQDWIMNTKKASAQSVNVTTGEDYKAGPIPEGMYLKKHPDGTLEQLPVKGGPLDPNNPANKAQQGAKETARAEGATVTIDTADKILKELDGSDNPQLVVGTYSQPFGKFSNTPAGKVRSLVGELQSDVALSTMVRLKEASKQGATGFGNMNQKELDLLLNAYGTLDPETTDPSIFRDHVKALKERKKRVIADIKKNVSPERIKELGLDVLWADEGGKAGGTTGGVVDYQDWLKGGQ